MSEDFDSVQTSMFGGDERIGEEVGDLERWCARRELDWIVGVDEAGRGPLAGPVHAAAVAVRLGELDASWIAQLDDSKKLTEAEREEAFDEIRDAAAACEITSASSDAIDELNILHAARKAMAEAAGATCEALEADVDCIFVDGDKSLAVDRPQRTLVRGDARSWAIAAASILAKVSRDRVMVSHHDRWPVYEFASNKGYPTPAHRRALEEHGPCEIHRRSFSGTGEA